MVEDDTGLPPVAQKTARAKHKKPKRANWNPLSR
jgi:hypothetical protein